MDLFFVECGNSTSRPSPPWLHFTEAEGVEMEAEVASSSLEKWSAWAIAMGRVLLRHDDLPADVRERLARRVSGGYYDL